MEGGENDFFLDRFFLVSYQIKLIKLGKAKKKVHADACKIQIFKDDVFFSNPTKPNSRFIVTHTHKTHVNVTIALISKVKEKDKVKESNIIVND